MEGVAGAHPLLVDGLARLGREGRVPAVEVREFPARRGRLGIVLDGFEEPPPHDLAPFRRVDGRDGPPDAVEIRVQRVEDLSAERVARLGRRRRDGGDEDSLPRRLDALHQGLQEREVAAPRADGERLRPAELPVEGDQLVEQDGAGPRFGQEPVDDLLAGRRAGPVALRHEVVARPAEQPVREPPPDGPEREPVRLQRDGRRGGRAVEHRHARPRQVANARLVQQRGDAREAFRRNAPRSEVVHGQQRVRLAAAEVRLQLQHGVSAGAREAPRDAAEQVGESLREVGPRKELLRVGVFGGRRSGGDLREVGREVALLHPSAEDVRVGFGDEFPGFHGWGVTSEE